MTYLTIPQAAEQANVAPITIRRAIKQGRLPAFRVGRLFRIDPEDFKAYVTAVPVFPKEIPEPRKMKKDGQDWRAYFGKSRH